MPFFYLIWSMLNTHKNGLRAHTHTHLTNIIGWYSITKPYLILSFELRLYSTLFTIHIEIIQFCYKQSNNLLIRFPKAYENFEPNVQKLSKHP